MVLVAASRQLDTRLVVGRVVVVMLSAIAFAGCGDNAVWRTAQQDAHVDGVAIDSMVVEDSAIDMMLDTGTVVTVDASTLGGPCNVLTQSACTAGQKCTWLVDAFTPSYVAHIGCAPDGPANLGDACMFGAAGATGFDNCKAGLVCGNFRGGSGICKAICDQQGGNPMCDAQHACVTYQGLFSTGDTTPAAAGVCDQSCDPLGDNDFDGSGALTRGSGCGSNPNVGCYGYPSYGTPPRTGWTCTADINAGIAAPTGLRHRVQCTEANNCADPGPQIYVNSCNQGYLPLLYEASGSTQIICVAMCRPLDCYSGNCGSNDVNRFGAPPHRCNDTDAVGTFSQATNGEHCQFQWWREVDDTGNLLPSPTSDSVGYCFDMSKYRYDSNGDNKIDTSDLTLPPCAQLQDGAGSGSNPYDPLTYFGATDLGCVDSSHRPAPFSGKPQPSRGHSLGFRGLYRRSMGAP